ncbi:MAG TPA: isoprenyl transferase [Candidatus Polarisedimenticolia bacterium]|nr:isoprenyl transferase [Candidatus Polarisedimenticolia bacterium]
MPRKTPDLHGYIPAGSEEESIVAGIDFTRLPAHVAIIMDGNGRWAQSRRLPRVAGHRAGIDAVRDVVEASARMGLQVLTLYAFSKENWKRPRAEVDTLMLLLKEYLGRELRTLLENDIRFNVIGRMDELAPSVQQELRKGMEATRELEGMVFNIALSYGGRAEIVDACRSLVAEAAGSGDAGAAGKVDEAAFAARLYTAGQPDPDLLIRTSGELRISNFLLWQIAYAEIWVTPTLWPDFRKKELFLAILDYQKRDRRYGGVGEVPVRSSGAPGRRRVV